MSFNFSGHSGLCFNTGYITQTRKVTAKQCVEWTGASLRSSEGFINAFNSQASSWSAVWAGGNHCPLRGGELRAQGPPPSSCSLGLKVRKCAGQARPGWFFSGQTSCLGASSAAGHTSGRPRGLAGEGGGLRYQGLDFCACDRPGLLSSAFVATSNFVTSPC